MQTCTEPSLDMFMSLGFLVIVLKGKTFLPGFCPRVSNMPMVTGILSSFVSKNKSDIYIYI